MKMIGTEYGIVRENAIVANTSGANFNFEYVVHIVIHRTESLLEKCLTIVFN